MLPKRPCVKSIRRLVSLRNNKKSEEFEKYQDMDADDRRWEAQRKVKRMVLMRCAMAALLVWVIIRFEMPVAMIALLIGVILVILGTMIPAIQVLKTDLKDPEE